MTATTSAPTVEQLLEFERAHQRAGRGRREEAVRHTFRISFARYLQLLRPVVLGDGEEHRTALEHDAVLTHHLADRWRARIARRSALIRRGTPTWP